MRPWAFEFDAWKYERPEAFTSQRASKTKPIEFTLEDLSERRGGDEHAANSKRPVGDFDMEPFLRLRACSRP